MSLLDITNKIEAEYAKILIDILESTNTSLVESKKQTKEFLALLPFVSLEDGESKLKKFTDIHKKFHMIYTLYLSLQKEEKTQQLLTKIQSLFHKGKIDDALQLVS